MLNISAMQLMKESIILGICINSKVHLSECDGILLHPKNAFGLMNASE